MFERIWKLCKAEWDSLITLFAAVVLTVLAGAGVLDESVVTSSIFAVLALLAFTILKGRVTGSDENPGVAGLRESLERVEEQVGASNVVQRVRPPHIGRRLEAACTTTRHYRFKGGTGTYLRAETLPRLVRRPKVRPIIWIETLAPDDVELCERYGNYRHDLVESNGDAAVTPQTTEEVRVEAYATVIAAAWYSRNRNIAVNLGLSSTMSTLRYDLTDEFVIVTNEDPTSTALLIGDDDDSSYLESVGLELLTSYDQSRRLDMTNIQLRGTSFSPDDVRRVLRKLDLVPAGDTFLSNDDVCRQIALKAISYPHARELGFAEGGARRPYPSDRPDVSR